MNIPQNAGNSILLFRFVGFLHYVQSVNKRMIFLCYIDKKDSIKGNSRHADFEGRCILWDSSDLGEHLKFYQV